MLQAHFEESDKKFIRDVKAYPDPAVVLATEQQLNDLEHFCCNPSRFCILTVDPTFSLGDFDVTPTTYHHLMLRSRRTNKPPVMLGPTLIHYRKTFPSYLFLAACMISFNQKLVNLQAFGTDGEKALINAFAHEFKHAVHLTCFNHVRHNIKEKLRKLAICEKVQVEILNDIFGRKVGSTFFTGLVDSETTAKLEQSLPTIMEKWKLHDEGSDHCPIAEFCSWFTTYIEHIIRDAMLRPVREQAGLGSPPEPFYTNASECINNVIKVKVNYRRNELSRFVEKLCELIEEQQQEVEKAVVGCGKYYLECSSFEVPQEKWFGLSQEQRRQLLKKFNDAPITSSLAESSASSNKPHPAEPSLPGSSQSTSSTSTVLISQQLSAKLSPLSGKLGLPLLAVEGIAKKAAEILQTDGAIVNAPGQPSSAKMVISRAGKRPHLVLPKKKSGGMSCDEDCPQYKSAKLCSHTVAAAEYNQQLDDFIASYSGMKQTPNLTKLATAGMPRGRGRKGSKAPAKRKSSVPVTYRVEQTPTSSVISPITPANSNSPSVQMNMSDSAKASVTVSPVYPPPSPNVASTSSSCYQYPTPLYPPSPALSSFTTFPQMTSYPPMSVPVYPRTCMSDPTSGGAYPFRVHFISGNISVCNGCKGRYEKLGPPHDICLQHKEWRTFTPQGSSIPQTRFSNVYYHCNVSCVMAVWPSFIPSSIIVPSEVQSCLLPEHKHWLYAHFGMFA